MKKKNDIKTWSAFIEEIQKEYSVEEKQSQATDGQRKRQPHIYHQQHLQRTYDHYSMETIVFEAITTVMDTKELEWPKQGEPWADYEIKPQRERFRKTTTNECDVLNEVINSGPPLSTTSKEGEKEEGDEKEEEEINDNKQEQLPSGVIGTMDKDRTLLLSKLYDVMKQFRVKRKLQPLLCALFSSGLSSPCFSNATSVKDSFLLKKSISDICRPVDGGGCRFIKHLLAYHKIFSDWNWLWPFLVP
ncbi:unnamed protein product [Didymodactylos carnosus]|uniref:Uncharacterized protein n=1 Tax=Didymodactylos carnosus TaxID=1234261 RepID=A0A8S2G209_9BILA|nr:unnamed protein product [Didymodactylos carnosus]CAF4403546.1 unnamed protein product [Didymodactylos carnosus]